MTTVKFIFLTITLLAGSVCSPQSKVDSLLSKLDPQKWASTIERKSEKLAEKIVAKSQRTLQRMQRAEEKLYAKMMKGKDSVMAKMRLEEMKERYGSLSAKLSGNDDNAGTYISQLDSTMTALKFLEANGAGGKVKVALAQTKLLQGKFSQAEAIQQFIRQRREQLKQQLQGLGMMRELKGINKEVYYYSAQLNEYKALLKDKGKRESKAMEMLSRTNMFKDFMRKNSQLASLFRLPGSDPVSPANLAGLQTRVQVNNLIQQQIAAAGPGGMQQFQQNIQSAQTQLQQLKDKILRQGAGGQGGGLSPGSGSDDIMPEGFKPNHQKTKGFWKRLELGTNLQNVRGNGLLPVTSDLGLSVGYKLNDKSVIGIGASYKMGWGKDIRHIKVTHEGAGLRSFIDYHLKGAFWLTGGYEMNYRSAFQHIDQLRDRDAWQQSGLIGLSKTVSVRSKFFKKTKLQLLWDFLSYEQVPRTQAVLVRVGYTIQ